VALHLEAPPAPVSAQCDGDRIQQVLWNLFSNAVKFTPRDGEIRVTVGERDGMVVIDVADTGVGITPDALPHVFERFWQGERRHGRRFGGLGLGLALARHFVELHGGTISVASEGDGRGATFSVRLPVASTVRGEAPQPSPV
jgi:signal transduction histidine kinase